MLIWMNVDWVNLFMVAVIWLLIVSVALWMIDRLFPRIQRSNDERSGKRRH